jgi:hypothetical protein
VAEPSQDFFSKVKPIFQASSPAEWRLEKDAKYEFCRIFSSKRRVGRLASLLWRPATPWLVRLVNNFSDYRNWSVAKTIDKQKQFAYNLIWVGRFNGQDGTL